MGNTKYTDGIHDISNSEYHASEGISRSMLMEFKRSPYHYWYKYVSGLAPVKKPTATMILGTAVHTLVLEEHKFGDEFAIKPELTKLPPAVLLKDVGKEKFEQIKQARKEIQDKNNVLTAAFDAHVEGKIVLSYDDFLEAKLMAKAINENPNSSNLFKDCLIEKSIYFTHKATGIRLKSRPDAMAGSIVIDLKTTVDASKRAFRYAAEKEGYFLQAVFAKEALASIGQSMDEFVFVPVEKSAPYCVAVYTVSHDTLFDESQDFEVLMANLARCMESNVWPGYGMCALERSKYSGYDNELEL